MLQGKVWYCDFYAVIADIVGSLAADQSCRGRESMRLLLGCEEGLALLQAIFYPTVGDEFQAAAHAGGCSFS